MSGCVADTQVGVDGANLAVIDVVFADEDVLQWPDSAMKSKVLQMGAIDIDIEALRVPADSEGLGLIRVPTSVLDEASFFT